MINLKREISTPLASTIIVVLTFVLIVDYLFLFQNEVLRSSRFSIWDPWYSFKQECESKDDDFEKELCWQDLIGKSKINFCEKMQNKPICYKFLARIKNDEEICEALNQEERDKCLALIATDRNKPEMCNKIKDNVIQNNCKKLILYQTKNEEVCNEVPEVGVPWTKDNCLYEFALLSKDPLNCEKTRFKEQCLFALAIENNDIETCNNLKDIELKDYCIMQISINKSENNCDKITTKDDWKNYCFAKVLNDISYCTNMHYDLLDKCQIEVIGKPYCSEKLNLRNPFYCKYREAVFKNDYLMCQQIKNDTLRDGCYYKIAIALNDPSLCYEISQTTITTKGFSYSKDICFEHVAKENLNLDSCYKISSNTQKDFCYDDVSLLIAEKEKSLEYCDKIKQNSAKKAECYDIVARLTDNYKACEKIKEINEYYEDTDCFKTILLNKQKPYLIKNNVYELPSEFLTYCDFKTNFFDITSFSLIEKMVGVHLDKQIEHLKCKINLTKNFNLCGLINPEIPGKYKMDCFDFVVGQTDNFSICSDIENEFSRAICYERFALNQSDLSICSNIPEKNLADKCKLQVTREKPELSTESLCEEMQNHEKDYCYQKLAIQRNDIELCEKINQLNIKTWCYIYIAEKYQKPEVCSKITESQYFKDTCYYKTSACELIKEEGLKSLCYSRKFDLEPASLLECEVYKSLPEKKDFCVYKYSIKIKENHCNLIKNKLYRDKCFLEIAEFKKDYLLCENILDAYEKDKCYNNVAYLIKSKEPCSYLREGSIFSKNCGEFLVD